MGNSPRKGTDLFKFPDPSGLSALEMIEQNREFYESNIREVEAQYGGEFVRSKEMTKRLLAVMQQESAMRNGTVSRQISLPDFPAEEFVAIPIVFDVKIPGGGSLKSKKWYFVHRSRLFTTGLKH